MEGLQNKPHLQVWVPHLFFWGGMVWVTTQLLVWFFDWSAIPSLTIAATLTIAALWWQSKAQGVMRRYLRWAALIYGVGIILCTLILLNQSASDLAKWF